MPTYYQPRTYVIKRNLVHSNHMVMTIDATNVQINYFYDYDMLVLHVILIVDVCTHIYNYSSHICDYNVDITK
jgi:hypothetical protein